MDNARYMQMRGGWGMGGLFTQDDGMRQSKCDEEDKVHVAAYMRR